MTEETYDISVIQAVIMLTVYGFDLKGYKPLELIEKWLKTYSAVWIRLALIEALYQGRYKAVSIEQILSFWSRRKQPYCHFTHEFERLICHNLTDSSDDASFLEMANLISLSPQKHLMSLNSHTVVTKLEDNEIKSDDSQPLKRKSVLEHPCSSAQEHCLKLTPTGRSIPQFTPQSDNSELYLKLRNVAHHTLAEEEFNTKQ